MKQPKYTVFSAGLETRQITKPVQLCIIALEIPTVGYLHFLRIWRGMLYFRSKRKSLKLIMVFTVTKMFMLLCCCY